MRFFVRNLHILVFAILSIVSASWVAGNQERAVGLMRPLVEDAVELKGLGQDLYRDIRQVSWQQLTHDAMEVGIASLRMPSMLFERLAKKLGEVEAEVNRPQHTDVRDVPELLRPSAKLEAAVFERALL